MLQDKMTLRVARNAKVWLALASLMLLCGADSKKPTTTSVESSHREWAVYGGNSEDIRYSSLKQINRSNVTQLEVAWTYDTADGPGATQTEPIVVNGILFGVTPKH